MQDIIVSSERRPVYAADDTGLLSLKNDALAQELHAYEAENMRLRRLIAKERRMRYRAYVDARNAEQTEPCLDAFQRVMFFAYGIVFAFAVFMFLLAVM